MALLWNNSTKSGLCDRLVDITLMSALGKIMGVDVYFNWEVVHDGQKYEWKQDINTTNEWKPERYVDYRYENFSQYFNLPKNLKINQHPPVQFQVFQSYLGGVYSPHRFHSDFLNGMIDLDSFLEAFKESLSEFTPKQKLLDIIGDKRCDISVHIRRQDKVRDVSDLTNITKSDLDELNFKTNQLLKSICQNGKTLYIASDENLEKMEYANQYNSITSDDFQISNSYETTYIDLYMMSKTEQIVMSQKHSSFSIFASLIGNKKLIYLYDNCYLINIGFDKNPNFIYYKNLIDQNNQLSNVYP